MSLRLRLTLTYAALMALILVAFSVVLFVAMEEALEAEMDRRLQVRANQVELTIWPGTTALTAQDITSADFNLTPLARLNAQSLYVQILGRDGRLVTASFNLRDGSLPIEPAALEAALAGERVFNDVSASARGMVRILSIPILSDGHVIGVLQVGQGRRSLQETMDGLRNLLQFIGLGALLVAGLVGWLVAQHGLRDLRVMSGQAAAIATRRDFTRRLHVGARRDEVGQLAKTIDQLLATVEDTLRTHREFVADTSHELRNPLLAIQANLDLVNRMPTEEARTECVEEARQQVQRMSRLVADLLILARVEAQQVVERRPVALGRLLEHVIHETRGHANGRRIELMGYTNIELLGDEGRLVQILSNLLDNAVKHTPPDGTIGVTLDRQNGWASVAVQDSGDGIAPEHLPRVFDRFYRVPTNGENSSNSTGLGLAIVKHLTEAHGGRVTVESELKRGSRFTIWLPVRRTR